MNLEKNAPDTYHRVLEVSTRQIRENETQGVDYDFLTDEEYIKVESELFESVKHQFLPSKYGAKKEELATGKWNIVVASIEGFLSGLKNMQPGDTALLVNIIIDTDLDVEREGRSATTEQNYNKGVLTNLLDPSGKQIVVNGKCSFYYELPLSKLKTIRTVPAKYIAFFNELVTTLIKDTLKNTLKNTESYDELISVFMRHSASISSSPTLLDVLEIQSRKFGKSVKMLCDDALTILRSLN